MAGDFGPHARIGNLVELRMGNYGEAVGVIELTVHLRSTSPAQPNLSELRRGFDQRLESLPAIRFRRSAKTLTIDVVSERITAERAHEGPFEPETYKAAAGEVESALRLVGKRIKATDDFDLERFLADVHAAASAVDEMTDWETICSTALERSAARAQGDPWDALGLDWSTFHPDARSLLDDLFFWSDSDDRSPHGNDTGHDLLDEFRRWNRRNPDGDPLDFLDLLLRSWGLAGPIGPIADDAAIRSFAAADPIAFDVGNQAAVALGFACLKVRGACSPEVAIAGLEAMDRTELVYADEERWDDAELRTSRERVRSKLSEHAR
jgi:uncharacterized protein YfeS